MILKNINTFINGEFRKTDITIENDIIASLSETENNGNYDYENLYAIPGLVDIHTHGCAGYDFSSANPDEINIMRKYYLKNGITSIMPTTVALSDENIVKAVNNIKSAKDTDEGAEIRGINLEGPYLSPSKCGAHDSSLLKEPDIDFIETLGDDITVVHVAPEYTKAFDFIRKFKGKVSIAHTSCDYATAKKAIELGADHITHIFNAMNGLHHREPGVIGAFFDTDAVAELICDSIHIADPLLRMMFNSYGDRIAIISDSMAATGLSDGVYKLGNLDVYVKDCVATLENGTLAGSAMNIYQMMKNLISVGIEKEKAILSATQIPAESVGIDDVCGKIGCGRKADILITDPQLNIVKIIHNGVILDKN